MDAFGKRQKSGAWIVYGKSGQGKTSFTFQLAREFDRIGYKVLFISLEMGVESDFRDSLLGFMNSSRSGMLFWDEVPTFDEFDEFLGKQRSPDVVIIDSLQSLEGEMDVTANSWSSSGRNTGRRYSYTSPMWRGRRCKARWPTESRGTASPA